jgi:serine/threonine protein kinase
MGAVYRATDLRTGGPVAVKALHPALARDPVYRERLRREALAAAALTSPRVVRVVDLDADAEPPYIVLEFVAGETLQERLRREGRLPPGEAVAVVLEIARALEDAHAHGIVHRDLTPRNVMLADGRVKVLDFGIARVAELPGLTAPGAVLGTPAYAPPEWASGAADGRADLYALGVILFALLEGHVPFRGPTAAAVLRQHEAAPLPQTAHTPPALLPVLRRCLAKDPGQRYQTAAELLAALDEERVASRAELEAALSGERYLALLDRLEAAGEAPLGGDGAELDDVWSREHRRLRSAVKALGDEPDDDSLHAARIKVKRARYAGELTGRKGYVKAAKCLQDILGEHQDAVVAEERLRALASSASAPAALAAGRLVERQRLRRLRARDTWRDAWARLARQAAKAA